MFSPFFIFVFKRPFFGWGDNKEPGSLAVYFIQPEHNMVIGD